MTILGINAYHADASAAILQNGELYAATEEERFTRIKHYAGFPEQAIRCCLNIAGISIDKVDVIAIGSDKHAKLLKRCGWALQHPTSLASTLRAKLAGRSRVQSVSDDLQNIFGLRYRDVDNKLKVVEHHRAHLASAYYPSAFSDAALLSIDGSGDFTTTMRGVGSLNEIEIIDSIDYPHSLGLLYTAVTQHLGFMHYGDEYKIMGLAPYGKPVHKKQLEQLIHFDTKGTFNLDLSYFNSIGSSVMNYRNGVPCVKLLFNEKAYALLGKPRLINETITLHHMNLASSVQAITEECIMHIANDLYERTHAEHLCLAGGVAQNSVANGKLHHTKFRKIYIPPAAHDAGIAVGAALWVHHMLQKGDRVITQSAFTGSAYCDAEIIALLKRRNVAYQLPGEKMNEIVSDALAAGKIVGWFKGRSEFGARALGGRSILADARRADMKHILNEKIKRREMFRPFAPAVMKEYADVYFEMNGDVRFMERVVWVKSNMQNIIPAAVHVDGTARVQTVDAADNSAFYELMQAFYTRTGVPVLLNTSFNEQEPIVESPEDALNCFRRTKIDMLVLEGVLVARE